MSSRPLRDWAFLGAHANSVAVLRVFDKQGDLLGAVSVTPGTVAKLAPNSTWSPAWDETWETAEVISVTNGPIYAAPVSDPTILTSASGVSLVQNLNLGAIPLSESADPKPSL